MYSIICLFPWLPAHYNFRAAVMEVFNITADQLVSLRKKRQHNIVIFTVASQEIFDSLSEFYCRILFFPIMGQNVLECFAYPKSPQYQFLRLSDDLDYDVLHTGNLSELGTIVYRCNMFYMVPFASTFQTDGIGVVLLRKTETNDSAEPEEQAAAGAILDIPVAEEQDRSSDAALQELISMVENFLHLLPDLQQSAKAPGKGKRASQEPSPKDEEPSPKDEEPSSKDEEPSPKDEEPSPKDEEPSPKDECPSETPKAEDQNENSSSDKQE